MRKRSSGRNYQRPAINRFVFVAILLMNSASISVGRPSAEEAIFQKRWEIVGYRAKEQDVSSKMTTAQVEAIIGKPDNFDWADVTVAGSDRVRVWMCVEKRQPELKSWRDGLYNHRHGLCIYYIFRNDHLVGGYYPALLGKDDEYLFKVSKVTASAVPL